MANEDTASPETPAKPNLVELVDRWFADHFPNSVVSRAGSEVWNLVHAAKENLKERLKGL